MPVGLKGYNSFPTLFSFWFVFIGQLQLISRWFQIPCHSIKVTEMNKSPGMPAKFCDAQWSNAKKV